MLVAGDIASLSTHTRRKAVRIGQKVELGVYGSCALRIESVFAVKYFFSVGVALEKFVGYIGV
jgi:hypothetical protein